MNKLLKKAINKHQAGDARGAEELYKKILRDDPNHLDGNYLLGALYAERGNLDHAQKYTERAARVAPRSPYVLNNLGNIARLRGDLTAAEAYYRAAIDAKPDMAEAFNNLGIVLKRLGQGDAAADAYQHAIDRNPLFVEAYFNLGKAHWDAERHAAAAACFERVLELKPDHVLALDGLGSYYLKTNEPERALLYFQKCVQLDPQDRCGARLKLAHLHAAQAPAQYPDELVRQTYETKAFSWDQDAARPDMRFLGPENVRAAIERCCADRRGMDVLDLGCGTGACGAFLRTHARRLDGVDLSPQMLRVAQEKALYDALTVGEVTEFLNSHAQEYDLIVASGVLIFFGDLGAVFTAVAHALHSQGIFIATAYRGDNEDVAVRGNFHFAHSAAHLRARAEAAGLKVTDIADVVHEYEHGVAQAGFVVVLTK